MMIVTATNQLQQVTARRPWYQANREAAAARSRAWSKAWAKRNRATVNKAHALWRAKHPHVAIANNAARYAAKLLRTPLWSYTAAQRRAVRAVYAAARAATRSTGVLHVVDHLYPLQGETVSGLHVAENLRVLPWRENVVKSNCHPEEYLFT